MTYGCQTWTLNKQLCHKLQTAQRAMERKMLNIRLKDRIPTIEIRKKTQVIDVVQYIKGNNGGGQDTLLGKKMIYGLKMHRVATKVRKKRQGQTRSKMDGCHQKSSRSTMAEEDTRSEEMEDICRGLHPAVDGHSLHVTK
ncbi:endonuclease-reverse transcriptase [Plakobranchus ocellatus]|uniref:Endonuclease-reverse transcriptase n=1 Tax=Plakobranchus ocellatus TaxID=259542 RepID=A0AAV4CXI3_9GAST|nr:endonuclease-reverse transcriptase [Plakobranchus ocellatus]